MGCIQGKFLSPLRNPWCTRSSCMPGPFCEEVALCVERARSGWWRGMPAQFMPLSHPTGSLWVDFNSGVTCVSQMCPRGAWCQPPFQHKVPGQNHSRFSVLKGSNCFEIGFQCQIPFCTCLDFSGCKQSDSDQATFPNEKRKRFKDFINYLNSVLNSRKKKFHFYGEDWSFLNLLVRWEPAWEPFHWTCPVITQLNILKGVLRSHFIMPGFEGLEAMKNQPGSNTEPTCSAWAVKSDPAICISL